jgi:lysyl-tRNA synthetase class 2
MCHAITIAYLSLRKMMGINTEGMLISAVHEVLNLLMVDDKLFAEAKLY